MREVSSISSRNTADAAHLQGKLEKKGWQAFFSLRPGLAQRLASASKSIMDRINNPSAKSKVNDAAPAILKSPITKAEAKLNYYKNLTGSPLFRALTRETYRDYLLEKNPTQTTGSKKKDPALPSRIDAKSEKLLDSQLKGKNHEMAISYLDTNIKKLLIMQDISSKNLKDIEVTVTDLYDWLINKASEGQSNMTGNEINRTLFAYSEILKAVRSHENYVAPPLSGVASWNN